MAKKPLLALALSAFFLAPAVHAADSMTKPGLWDMNIKMTYNKGGPQVSPEQQAMMKQMGIDPFNISSQRCITAQEAAQEFDASKVGDPQSGCKSANIKHSGNRATGEYVCDGKLKGKGTFESTQTADGFTAVNTFAGTSTDPHMGGGAIDMRMDITGKFLKADCGDAGKPGVPGLPPGLKLPPGVKLPPAQH